MTQSGLTLSEQILSHAAGHPVKAGDLVIVQVDRCMTHDSLTPEVIDVMRDVLRTERVFDPRRVAVMIDHVAPAASVATADAQVKVRKWVREQGIPEFFDAGAGVCHQIMIEQGRARWPLARIRTRRPMVPWVPLALALGRVTWP